MNLLLDTQALLWFLLDDPRLSKNARESIITQDALIFVSPASLWEIAIKISLGKYALPVPSALTFLPRIRVPRKNRWHHCVR